MTRTIVTTAFVYCAAVTFGAPAPNNAIAFLQLHGKWKETASGKSLEQSIQLDSDAISFGMKYDIIVPNGTEPGKCSSRQWVFEIKFVPLGMTNPVGCNWYAQGFFTVHVDGMNLYDRPIKFQPVRASGPDALAEGVWSTPKGPVFLRLLLRGGDDKLMIQAALGPDTRAKEIELELLAYPQGFQKPWNRRMFTPDRDLASTQVVNLEPAKEPWAVFYDSGMQGKGARGGPCGFVYAPEEATAQVNLGAYSVRTLLKSRPGQRHITAGLWDFNMERNVEANRDYLLHDGSMIAKDVAGLAESDWHAGPVLRAQVSKKRLAARELQLQKQLQPTPYDTLTSEVHTPCITWARPLPRGPVHALVIAPRWSQRETVELAQRLDLDYETVCFSRPDAMLDSRWLYLYGSFDLYGYARKSASSILAGLQRKLRQEYDCLILSSFDPRIVPEGLRKILGDKVRAGTGLLMFGSARKMLDDLGERKPIAWEPAGSVWKSLPIFEDMIAQKRPVWKAGEVGKGRVIAFNYHTGGKYGRHNLTPYLNENNPDALGSYDYYHSLVAKAVLWASRREAPVQVDFPGETGNVLLNSSGPVPGADVEVMIDAPDQDFRRSYRQKVDLPLGRSTHALTDLGLASGPRYVSVKVKKEGKVLGWGTTRADLDFSGPRIQSVGLPSSVIHPGQRLAGTVELNQPLTNQVLEVEVRDALGRVLRRKQLKPEGDRAAFEFTLPQPLTILHEVRARLKGTDRIIDQCIAEFTMPQPFEDGDYHFLAWIDGANDAMAHAVLTVLAENDVDWIDNVGLSRADARRMAVWCRNAARHGLRSIPYSTRIACEAPQDRVRQPCLTDPAHLQPWLASLRERARGAAPFSPPGYTLGDENFLVRPKHDVCTSPTCLAAFRDYLNLQYGSIDKLNASWQTKLASFGEASPSTLPEVKDNPASWPRWADHRQFMDTVLTNAHAMAREAIREADPRARVGFDGVFSLNSWYGYDFYQLCRACDMLEVYASRLHQIEYLRSWHRPGSIRGAWFNRIGNADATSAKRLSWHLLFHQFNSSWYWMAYSTGPALLFPDLRPTPQLKWMGEAIGEIQRGIGKLLLRAKRQHDGIAILYSQSSVHAGTLMGRRLAEAQWGFARLIEDLGLQYDMVSYEQVSQGVLSGYKALLLPACASLKPAEAGAIRSFVEKGGLVIADTAPGILDGHCRLLPRGMLGDLFGITRTGLPKPAGDNIQLNHGSLKGELALATGDTQVRADGARAWASAAGTPCVLVRKRKVGATVLLNTPIEGYEELHRTSKGRPVQSLMQTLLALAGIRAQVQITSSGNPVDACETVRFDDGGIEYVCIVKDDDIADPKAEDVTVRLPRKSFVYDVRAGKALGPRRTVEAKLLPGDPLIYALVPSEPKTIQVKAPAVAVRAGTKAAFEVKLETAGKGLAGPHCLHVEFLGPDGKVRRHYTRNILTRERVTAISIALALNDSPGPWQVRTTDAATGLSTRAAFRVEVSR